MAHEPAAPLTQIVTVPQWLQLRPVEPRPLGLMHLTDGAHGRGLRIHSYSLVVLLPSLAFLVAGA